MSVNWYYVSEGDRKGPIDEVAMFDLIQNGHLTSEDYVWKKGFEDWKQIKEVEELVSLNFDELPVAEMNSESYSLKELSPSGNKIFIKIGADRGVREVEYGPYSLELIVKLFNEKRINARTFIFVQGMEDWILLGEFSDFENIFNDVPPIIEDQERRTSQRKPFVARMFIQNQKDVFTGVCRDISVGGMQVLVDHFPGKNGDRISINVHPENTDYHFVASGEIVRILDGGQGFSFRFSELKPDSLDAIEKYLKNG